MSSEQAAKAPLFDKVKWALVFLLVAVGVVGNSYYSDASVLYRVLALVALGVVAAAVALATESGRALLVLLKESRNEIRKVVWPTRPELTQTTLIVVVFVLIVAIILWGIDTLIGWLVSGLIG